MAETFFEIGIFQVCTISISPKFSEGLSYGKGFFGFSRLMNGGVHRRLHVYLYEVRIVGRYIENQ